MYDLKKIMVCLDATEIDNSLVEFASFLARTESAESIHFVNIIKKTQLPTDLKKEFPDLMERALIDRKKELEKKVIERFDLTLGIKVKIAVETGSMPSRHILKLAEKHNIDAIVVGRKQNIKSSSVVTQRLARRATCSLLVVPEKEYTSVSKIMVAADFSKESVSAMKEAVAVALKESTPNNQVEIILHHSYQVPVGYHYSGKSFEQSAMVMKENAKKNYRKFMNKIDTKGIQVTPNFTLVKNEDVSANIEENARKHQVDLLVIGGKGKTASTAFIPIGTNTEKLISRVNDIPLLVVRPKHKNAGLIEMLQRI